MATRHGTTLAAHIDRVRVDPWPGGERDLHTMDTGSLDRLMQLVRVRRRDLPAVAEQPDLRRLRRMDVHADAAPIVDLAAHRDAVGPEGEAAGGGDLVVRDVAAAFAQRVVDKRPVVLELPRRWPLTQHMGMQLLERALVAHQAQRHAAADSPPELVSVEAADRHDAPRLAETVPLAEVVLRRA